MNKIKYFLLPIAYVMVLLGYIDTLSKEFLYLQVITIIMLIFMSLYIILDLAIINHSSLEKLSSIEDKFENDFENLYSAISLGLLLIIYIFVLSFTTQENMILALVILLLIFVRIFSKLSIIIWGITKISNREKELKKQK